MPDPNPYDQTATDLFNGTLALGAQSSVATVANRNPDEEARIQQKAQQLGIPYESARANPDLVKQRLAAQGVDWQNMARTAPRTAKFLSSTSNAAIAHDDVGVLGALEQKFSSLSQYLNPFSGPANIGSAIGNAISDTVSADVKKQGGVGNYFRAVGHDVTPSNIGHSVEAGLNDLGTGIAGAVEGVANAADNVDPTAAAQRAVFGGTAEEALAHSADISRLQSVQDAQRLRPKYQTLTGEGVGSGVEALPTMGVAVAGGTLGGVPLSLALFGGTAYGQSYGSARDQGLDEGSAQVKAIIDGTIAAAAGVAPETAFLKDIAAGAGFRKFVADQLFAQIPSQQLIRLGENFNHWRAIGEQISCH